MEEQQGQQTEGWTTPDSPSTTSQIWAPSRQQTSQDNRSGCQVGASVPCRKESPLTNTHTFVEVLHGLGSGDPLSKCPSGSSLMSVVNLFCSYKPLGGAGTFFLVPEVTPCHRSPSPEVSLTLMIRVDAACFRIADIQATELQRKSCPSPIKLLWCCTACSLL